MGRSREAIQADIDALQAELAAIQPRTLTLNGDLPGRTIEFAADGVASQPRICVRRDDPYEPQVIAGLQIVRSDVPAIVAWLNYHFPKTEVPA